MRVARKSHYRVQFTMILSIDYIFYSPVYYHVLVFTNVSLTCRLQSPQPHWNLKIVFLGQYLGANFYNLQVFYI